MNSIQAPQLPTTAPQEPESALSPALILRAVRKHWVILVVTIAVCLLSAWVYTNNQRKIYEAVASVQLDPQPVMPLGNTGSVESGYDNYWSNLEYFATQHQVITSRKIAMLVVGRLGLAKDSAFIANTLPPGPVLARKFTTEEAAEVLRARLKVEPIEDSRLARVKYTDADPARAQRILSAVVDTYVEQNLDSSLAASNKTSDWLDTQLARLKTELESQEMDLHDYKSKYNLLSVSYDDQTNMLRMEIQQLNSNLTAIKSRRESVLARLSVLQKVNLDDPTDVPSSELVTNGALGALRSEYVMAARKRAELLAEGKGEQHPEVRTATSALESTRTALVRELQNVKEGCALDLASVNRELGGLSGLYETAKQQALELNLKELEFSRLRRSKDNTEKLFGMVLERSTESGMSKMMPFNNVRVLDRPLKPIAPIFPKMSANLALGLVAGLLLGFAGALGRDLLDRTVRNAEDAERELGLASLGSLPDVQLDSSAAAVGYYGYGRRRRARQVSSPDKVRDENLKPELLVHSHPKSVIAEAARAIRTNLMFMSPDHPFRCLLVTSAGPSEGKTTVAANIAVAMAQTGQSVCLVDCDLRRPRVHALFGESNDVGITTALLDPSQLGEIVASTDVPNLFVLRAGPTPPNPADLMHSEAFGRILEALRARFDRIVVDSPPIGLVTDGVIVSTRVDATVLVVRALTTRRDAARKAVRTLRDVGANCAGFVLNAVATPSRGYYTGYYAPYATRTDPAEASPAA